MDYRYLSTEVIGGFTGVMLGLFAQGDDGYADFDWFEYTTELRKEHHVDKGGVIVIYMMPQYHFCPFLFIIMPLDVENLL